MGSGNMSNEGVKMSNGKIDILAKVVPTPDDEVDKFVAELDSKPLGQIFADIDKGISDAIEKDAVRPVQLSWLPTDTARKSIFRPIADQKLEGNYTDFKRTSAWGTLEVSGPPLNMVDEGILLALLLEIRKARALKIKVNYKGICKSLKISDQTKNRNRIKLGIMKLRRTAFTFDQKGGKWTIKNIIKEASGDKEYSHIELDPWFFDKFLKNEITMLDLEFRQTLKGDIVKSLYRFISSHRGTQTYRLETLVLALNMNLDRETRKNRDTLKRAFAQLKTKKFCTFRFKEDLFFNIKLL
jgi:hypothetical protein